MFLDFLRKLESWSIVQTTGCTRGAGRTLAFLKIADVEIDLGFLSTALLAGCFFAMTNQRTATLESRFGEI